VIDLRRATDMIVMQPGHYPPQPGETHMQLLGDGLVHVDYGEPEQVFLVRVIQVPRVPLLDTGRPLGDLGEGVEAWLAAVSVDNYLTVTLEGRGAGAEAALQTYRDQYARWEATAQTHPGAVTPEWPGERLLSVIPTLSDDADTQYHIDAGQTGGPEREWLHVWQYRPTPPAKATTLHLAVQVGEHLTTINLALPGST
jgi:hypothetical protein